MIKVTLALPGMSKPIVEEYDLLNVESCVCWILNTKPPYMQLNVESFGENISFEDFKKTFNLAKEKSKLFKKHEI